MPEEFIVSEDVKELVNKIIKKYNVKGISDIKYEPGSEVGDGYVSKTVAVDIINGTKKFRIFLKCALNVKSTDAMPIERLYENEIYFYDVIYPAYLKFSKSRGVEDSLLTIPKCYGTGTNLVALENIKEKNFVLCDRTRYMNDRHIKMVLKAFAKFHAVSFAFKDQEREKYEELVKETYDFFSGVSDNFTPYTIKMVNELLEKFDPVKDKDLLKKCENIAEILSDPNVKATSNLNEYSILTQGDCHCNNMMFLYEDKHRECPSDIMLVDWQIIRPASVTYDLSYFFYPVASKEALNKQYDYLKYYHNELSKEIRRMGSDPDRLYPFEVLKKEWKQHSRYGFMASFNIIRLMLSAKEEVFKIEDFDFENMEQLTDYDFPKLKKEDEYHLRLKIILEHMVENDFLSKY